MQESILLRGATEELRTAWYLLVSERDEFERTATAATNLVLTQADELHQMREKTEQRVTEYTRMLLMETEARQRAQAAGEVLVVKYTAALILLRQFRQAMRTDLTGGATAEWWMRMVDLWNAVGEMLDAE